MDLFDNSPQANEPLGPGAILLRGFASDDADTILSDLYGVVREAPFRQMITPGGWQMSVAMTNCGSLGWVTDRTGYRYDPVDPETGRLWPAMPAIYENLARRAAEASGFARFEPDACLINRYEPGARLSLHQDRNERDYDAPIVSVSLGVPATFLWGGMARSQRPRRLRLTHGDVVVWGGPFHIPWHRHPSDSRTSSHRPSPLQPHLPKSGLTLRPDLGDADRLLPAGSDVHRKDRNDRPWSAAADPADWRRDGHTFRISLIGPAATTPLPN